MDAIEEIKKLYYSATKATIQRDLSRAIDLLKSLPGEEERERVAVYMDGLSQMRSEWSASTRSPSRRSEPSRSASAPPDGAARERSGRSPASSRRRR